MKFATVAVLGTSVLALAACDGFSLRPKEAPRADAKGVAPAALPAPDPAVQPSTSPIARAVDQAAWTGQTMTEAQRRDLLLRAQVLLDRAHFSPGVIDGQDGENARNAVMAFERANDLPVDGQLDAAVWTRLTADARPALTDYVITADDVAGPFVDRIPEDYVQMAALDRLAFSGPLEALAERFHMDPTLLQALNPGVDFARAGTRIVVAAVSSQPLPAKVAVVEVDKALKQVRAYDSAGRLLAAYPATVGSGDNPTPSGEWAVRAVAHAPTWTYDPSRLNFGDRKAGRQTIAAGPNNPVGAVWIDLTKDTYGIHGTPEPELVGKAASHGCVRLTNWDAEQLARAVDKGARVVFVGESSAKTT